MFNQQQQQSYGINMEYGGYQKQNCNDCDLAPYLKGAKREKTNFELYFLASAFLSQF